MDVFEAAYRVAHDYRDGGAAGLARKMGVHSGTFLNELNQNQETHKLGLGTAVRMSTAADDTRILDAFADTMGRITLPAPPLTFPCDTELIALLLQRDRKAGEFARVIEAALADGRITRAEVPAIRVWGLQLIRAVTEIMVRMESAAHD